MPAHVHAVLMAEYAKDSAETDKPWERWEWRTNPNGNWVGVVGNPAWCHSFEYRRKRLPLLQVEGKDVFPGDKLWFNGDPNDYEDPPRFVTVSRSRDEKSLWLNDCSWVFVSVLSWAKPPRTKTVYQWAGLSNDRWISTTYYYATEQEVKERAGYEEVRRLDYTAMEVPV